jgi:hypothetical protein
MRVWLVKSGCPACPPALQVDAFELAVETPPAAGAPADRRQAAEEVGRTPQCGDGQQGVARALAAAAPTPGTAMRQRAMSLGLSRRRSSAVPWPVHAALASSSKANQSPLKLSMRPGAASQRWVRTEGPSVLVGRIPACTCTWGSCLDA